MEKRDQELIGTLVDRDPELREKWEEHLLLEGQLAELQKRLHLSTDEEVEKKRLQKLKLAGKDRIMEILSKYR
jgi:uncharacterized protein